MSSRRETRRHAAAARDRTRAFSVGACTVEESLATFSSYNPGRDNPDVTAIGVDNRLAQARQTKLGIDLAGPWVKASGTSFAAPEVAAMVARYWERVPDATPEELKEDFESGARNLPDDARDGGGIVVIDRRSNMPGRDSYTERANGWLG